MTQPTLSGLRSQAPISVSVQGKDMLAKEAMLLLSANRTMRLSKVVRLLGLPPYRNRFNRLTIAASVLHQALFSQSGVRTVRAKGDYIYTSAAPDSTISSLAESGKIESS